MMVFPSLMCVYYECHTQRGSKCIFLWLHLFCLYWKMRGERDEEGHATKVPSWMQTGYNNSHGPSGDPGSLPILKPPQCLLRKGQTTTDLDPDIAMKTNLHTADFTNISYMKHSNMIKIQAKIPMEALRKSQNAFWKWAHLKNDA